MMNGSDSQFFPPDAKDVDISSTDADLTALWPDQGYARAIYVGTSGNLKVTYLGGTTVIHYNVPVGDFYGCFTAVVKLLTTASQLQARK